MARTRHGNYGGPRMPYGSFAGKSENAVITTPGFCAASETRASYRSEDRVVVAAEPRVVAYAESC